MMPLVIVTLLTGALCIAAGAHVEVVLGESAHLPCGVHEGAGLQVVEWRVEGQLVVRWQSGELSYSSSYRGRAQLAVGDIRTGDCSINITHTQHGDNGMYTCIQILDEQEITLAEVQLSVKVPHPPAVVFVKAGETAVLPCWGRVDWSGLEVDFVQWKWDPGLLLQWEQGMKYVGPEYEGKVSLSRESVLQDNLSLTLSNADHRQQGQYLCFYRRADRIILGAQINLTVTDHMTKQEAAPGFSLLLHFHTTAPVSVWFLPDGGNKSVCVCEVVDDRTKCGAMYTNRTVLHNYTLQVSGLSESDSGTFSVMERETSRTTSVLVFHILSAGTERLETNSLETMIILIIVSILLSIVLAVICIGTIRLMCNKSKLHRQFQEQDKDHHLKCINRTEKSSVADSLLEPEHTV